MMRDIWMLTLAVMLAASAGCRQNRPPDRKKVAATVPAPPIKKARPAPPPEPDCPYLYIDNKKTFFCEITYRSIKEYKLDGSDAKGKRGVFTCRYTGIMSGDVYCKINSLTVVIVQMDRKLKPVLRKLKRRQKVAIDMVITYIGALGPRGTALSIKPIK